MYRISNIKIALLLLPALFFVVFYGSCTPEVTRSGNGETLFVNAYLRYALENIQVRGELQLMKGDSALTATAYYPENARFQGHTMRNLTTMQSARYAHSFHAEYQTPYTFRFSGLNNEEHEINVTMSPVGHVISEAIIPADRQFTFEWEGNPLNEKESMTLLFTARGGKELTLNILGPTSANKFTFNPSQLEEFDADTGTLHVIKRKTELIRKPGLEARVRTEFYLRDIPLIME